MYVRLCCLGSGLCLMSSNPILRMATMTTALTADLSPVRGGQSGWMSQPPGDLFVILLVNFVIALFFGVVSTDTPVHEGRGVRWEFFNSI
jgi:hypothetical protein